MKLTDRGNRWPWENRQLKLQALTSIKVTNVGISSGKNLKIIECDLIANKAVVRKYKSGTDTSLVSSWFFFHRSLWLHWKNCVILPVYNIQHWNHSWLGYPSFPTPPRMLTYKYNVGLSVNGVKLSVILLFFAWLSICTKLDSFLNGDASDRNA